MDMDTITISINENENVVELLNRMLELKKENNKEVECNLNGRLLTTTDCESIEEMVVKNDSIILSELEKDREELINNPTVQNAISTFSARCKHYTGDELDFQQQAHDIQQKEAEFNKKIKELDTLNYDEAINVYNWLNSIVEYVNDPDLYLPTGLDKVEYHTMANYIVKRLEEKGYQKEVSNEINNINDHYKKLISYQLSDLDKYNFFIYYYADNLRDKNMLEQPIESKEKTEEVYDIEKLLKEKEEITSQLTIIEMYEKGILHNYMNRINDQKNSESFDVQKQKIKKQIEELQEKQKNEQPVDVIEEFSQARSRLESILYKPDRFSTEEENDAIRVYYTATAFPGADNVIKALESASSLPDSSEIKVALIDAIVKLVERYPSLKDEEEQKLLNDTLARLNIQKANFDYEEKINLLNTEILNIEKEQQERIDSMSNKKNKLKSRVDEINTIIENQNQKQESSDEVDEKVDLAVPDEIEEENQPEEVEIENPETTIDNSEVEEETVEENFADKLSEIAEEGRIFSDQSRINPEDSWMEQKTAQYFGKYNDGDLTTNNETVQLSSENKNIDENHAEIEETDLELERNMDDLIPMEDKIPHAIESVKKATSKLLDKIYQADFKNKIKKCLEFLRKHKIAIATAIIAGSIFAGSIITTAAEEKVTENSNINTENETDNSLATSIESIKDTMSDAQNTIATNVNNSKQEETQPEKSEDELFEEELQNSINSILGGESKVYISANDAIQNTSGISPTNRQLENSWTNANAGAFYDSNAKVLTQDEAEDIIANGGEVVVRYDNNGIPIGYAVAGQEANQNTSEVTK